MRKIKKKSAENFQFLKLKKFPFIAWASFRYAKFSGFRIIPEHVSIGFQVFGLCFSDAVVHPIESKISLLISVLSDNLISNDKTTPIIWLRCTQRKAIRHKTDD